MEQNIADTNGNNNIVIQHVANSNVTVNHRSDNHSDKIDVIIVFGSATHEKICQITSDLKIGEKHTIDIPKVFYGGSGVNYSLRLINQENIVIPILSVGADHIGKSIQSEIFNAYKFFKNNDNLSDDNIFNNSIIDKYIKSDDFHCKSINTSQSTTIIRYRNTRTVLAEKLDGIDGYEEFVKNKIALLKSDNRLNIKAVMIGHIYTDANKNKPIVTEHIINEFIDTHTLIFINMGNSQLAYGFDYWKAFNSDRIVFQFSFSEVKRLFHTNSNISKINEIMNEFKKIKVNVIITLDKLGAIARFRDDERIIMVWPFELADKLLDTTGAGDAFGAGFVANFLNSRWDFHDFQRAIEQARVWAAYACTTEGAAYQCPNKSKLQRFQNEIERKMNQYKVEVIDKDYEKYLFLIERAFD